MIYAVPLVMVFATSLFDYRLNAKDMTFIGFGNYSRLFRDPDFFSGIVQYGDVDPYPVYGSCGTGNGGCPGPV